MGRAQGSAAAGESAPSQMEIFVVSDLMEALQIHLRRENLAAETEIFLPGRYSTKIFTG